MAVIGSDIYLFGGNAGSNNQPKRMNDLWVFRSDNETWEKLAVTGDTPAPVMGHTAEVYNDKMYIFGGIPSVGWSGEMFEYDFAANCWAHLFGSANSSDAEARANHAADATDSSTAFVFGGFGYGGLLPDLKRFSTAAPGSLQTLAPRTFQGRNNSSLTALKNDHLTIYGGVSGNKTLDELYLYGVSSNVNKKFLGSVTGLPAR